MKLNLLGYKSNAFSPVEDALRTMRSSNLDPEDQHLLFYTPVARVNPYQDLIYRSFPDRGISVAPVLTPASINQLMNFPVATKTKTIHLHWNSWMTQNSDSESAARSRGLGAVGRAERLRNQGFNVIWTVHNVYPHDAKYIDVELEIQQKISDISTVVHTMSSASMNELKQYTNIDENKILISPHPSYTGSYPNYVSKTEARSRLGIDGDEIVLVMFGAIKAYKGLLETLEAFDELRRNHPLNRFRLIVAGKADESAAAREFVKRALSHPFVLIENQTIPNDRVQIYLNAADIGLANYTRSLNSGAVLLYGTFGLPAVVANTATFHTELDPLSTKFVSGDSSRDYANAISEAVQNIGSQEVADSLKKWHLKLDSSAVSGKFADDLLKRLV